jgi:hypothetical protein
MFPTNSVTSVCGSTALRTPYDLVADIEADVVERKIREGNPLGIDRVAVAVRAGENAHIFQALANA